MPVPNSFANVTTSIPLSQLDANFNTPITLGNTAIQLGNTVTTLNNMTLANVTVTSGNVTITNVSVTTANVTTANIGTQIVTTSQTLNYGTANGVVYLNGSKVSTTGTALTYDGTTLTSGAHTLSTGVLTVPLGTAAAPSLTFSGDTNTGIFSPAADTIAFTEGGVESMRIDSAGNVGIGTSSPGARLQVTDGNFSQLYLNSTTTVSGLRFGNTGSTTGFIYYDNGANMLFNTNNAERARITSDGNLLVGTTSAGGDGVSIQPRLSSGGTSQITFNRSSATQTGDAVAFNNGGTRVGTINYNNTSTAYVTSSDYRLKENIAPMTGALSVVQQLKPCTYNWKVDGSDGQGFIAHELQEVVPEAVSGEKDAVDEEGNIKPQGIDTSFLVATLTAAIQEQQQMIETLQAKVAALEGKK